jgi:hypothetical protein
MAITIAYNYVSPSSQDPAGLTGFGGAGSIWAQSDTSLYFSRNSGNTNWILIGSGEQTSFGLFSLGGGTVSGAISGANGIMTADGNTPFQVPPTITSKSSAMATMLDLYNFQQAIYGLITETVENSLASVITPSIRSNMAFNYGPAGPAGSPGIPIILAATNFSYSNGVPVQTSECIAFATQNAWISPQNGNATGMTFQVQNAVGMSWISESFHGVTPVAAGLQFMMIAIRAGA